MTRLPSPSSASPTGTSYVGAASVVRQVGMCSDVTQEASHPSRLILFPSSQVSFGPTFPSPPLAVVQSEVHSPSSRLSGPRSPSSVPSRLPSPHVGGAPPPVPAFP